ncbi:MAG TPA: hypothetical protein VMT89_07300, partial [Candidatus Acidoferrales bacterium]|nr:hypothetical protein [Candidatus Acidoferrales bacterium]
MSSPAVTSTGQRSSLWRFLAYVAPHTWYIVGAAVTGVFKFIIPLTFPLVLKYLTDVVLTQSPTAAHETANRWVDAWCTAVVRILPWFGSGNSGKVWAIGTTLLLLYAILGVVSFY